MLTRTTIIAGLTVACIAAALFVPALPQPLDYYHFADSSSILAIANGMDVLSNIVR